ncbi:MAG: response regulator [Anaerolineales bacterium]|nr:response regulator [Anaerolineales bacterium]
MSGKRILVVEDNMDSYQLVKFVLEKKGHETFLAMNGRDGFNAAIKQKPDLIIMDLAMPMMDGWIATEKLKAEPATKNITIVALTAHALPADRMRAMDAGCSEYITKPINLQQFMEIMEHWLGRV